MIIAIGSTNKIKVQAVEEVAREYSIIADAELLSFEVSSGVSEQPLSLNETVQGAKNRAKNAFEACGQCKYSIGLESGLMEIAESKTGFMEFSVCCIYDGQEFYFGQSCAFELPQQIIDLITNQKLDLCEACYQLGLTSNPQLGAAEGIIGILTKGRITRKDYTKQSIMTALIQLENAEVYALASVSLNALTVSSLDSL